MKEKILEILQDSFIETTLPGINENDLDEGFIFDSDKASNTIDNLTKEHYMKFVPFCMDKVEFDSREDVYRLLGRDDDDQLIFYTLDDLFTYWLENIEK